jgi:actin-like ATPase involved in cell morphogenesis
MIVFGVDFGMSTSSLAVLGPDGAVRLAADAGLRPGSQHAVPTAVCLDESGAGLLVGSAAVNAKLQRPEVYRDNFKLDVKVDAPPVFLAGRPFPVVELVTAVLAFLRDRAREIDPRDPAATVLTVPVDWAKGRRHLMIEAAVAAGFPADTLYLVEEPIAAVEYARSMHVVADNDTVLVYDLGGGTFDCAVVKPASTGQPGIRLKDALPFGGHYFDLLLRAELGRRFPEQVGAVLNGTGDVLRLMQLLESCESLKIRLSYSERVREPLTELAEPVTVEITRTEFQGLIGDLIEQTMKCSQKMLGDVGLTWEQVDAVVPVGGSSRIPLVELELEARAPSRVRTTSEQDTAVVLGAALLARQRADRAMANRRPGPQEVAPPGIWVPHAVQAAPEIVGIRPYQPFDRRWRAWTWATVILCVLAAGGLAWLHWRWTGAVTVTALAVLAVAGAMRLTTMRPGAGGLMVTGTGLMSLILLIVSMVLGYRTLIEHHTGNGVTGWWALGAGLAAFASAIVQSNASDAANNTRTSRAPSEEDASLVERLSEQHWFGPTQTPPDFAQRLFAIPALCGFDLSADSAAAAFDYALAAGSQILLISMLTSADDRPELVAAAARWSLHLAQDSVIDVKTILVVSGYELPTLRADEQFSMTDMTTTLAFADTVGHWLDRDDNRILLPVVRSLLSGPARAVPSA